MSKHTKAGRKASFRDRLHLDWLEDAFARSKADWARWSARRAKASRDPRSRAA